MSSTVDKAGRKVTDRGNKALSQEVVRLLKTQDAAYIRTMLQMTRKEREELEQKIMLEGEEIKALGLAEEEERKRNHTVFVGDKEEQRKFKPDEWFGKGDEMPKRKKEISKEDDEEDDAEEAKPKKLSKKQQEAQLLAEKERRALRRQRERTKERLAIHLEAVKLRERELATAEDELEKQRAKMNNTVGGINKNGVKFKIRERKR
jgi:U3 small nucleolar RNA-associated protein 11